MAKTTSRLIQLVYEATLKSFWRKEALRKFLRANHVSESHISTWSTDESKRDFLDRTFQRLQSSEKGNSVIQEMANSLAEQSTFPDLRNWEDSAQKISEATHAVADLKEYIRKQKEEVRDEQNREAARAQAHQERQRILRSQTDKNNLRQRLEDMHLSIGTQQGGYEFQRWFYDLLDYAEIQNRRPYVTGGRQIDGSLTLDGTTYLIELKFTGAQSTATDIDSLRAKVEDKADNTMGIMISISGYSSVAIANASGRQTKLILLDASHIYLFLLGDISFSEVIARIRRHASQTGEATLPSANFND